MKISKLFHWLYGVIMLLPIFAIGVTSLVSTFNMSAKQESEIIYKYETNEVNSNDDIVHGNIYLIDFTNFNSDFGIDDLFSANNTGILSLFWVEPDDYELTPYGNPSQIDIDDDSNPLYITGISFTEEIMNFIYFYGWYDNYMKVETENFAIYYQHNGFRYNDVPFVIGDFQNLNNDFYKYVKPVIDLSLIPIDYVETHNVNPQDVFYNAIDKVQQSPLFNWAYESFLVAPFSYIVSLFSMPSNSFIVMLLSYWLAISIIWLVFDLVMYIPLLVHRWLDKGVLE